MGREADKGNAAALGGTEHSVDREADKESAAARGGTEHSIDTGEAGSIGERYDGTKIQGDVWEKPCMFTASVITLDLCNLESQVKELETCGVELLHVDILDGHFSPSMPLGLDTVRQLRKKTDLAFDCHVMATEPDFFVDELLDIGVEQVVFQAETQPHIDGMLNRIHARGVRAGVALKPATPLSVLDYVLEKCDTVLLMLINPGYASMKGESQVSYADRKIRELRKMIDDRGLPTKISLDGRISPQNVRDYGGGLADQFVLGSTCIRRGAMRDSISELFRMRETILRTGLETLTQSAG